jgi:predicted DNA-binding transcriptional regulator YafY
MQPEVQSMQAGYRTLAIWKILREYSDEEHPMNAVELSARLHAMDMDVERRSVYRSLEELEQAGVDIVHEGQKNLGFYLGQREFELAEIKLLMDAVQAARFITGRKSKELVHKLAALMSRAQAEALLGSVFLEERAKCANEQIYYNIDHIYDAIRRKKQIAFKYCEYDLKKRRVERRGGEDYTASPYALEWNSDAYYLVSRLGTLQKFTHFRVDRMKDIRVLDEPALPYSEFYDDGQLNIADYGKRAFSMFEGPVEDVQIRFRDNLVTAVIDRMGSDVRITPDGDGWFVMRADLVVSPGLTAWLAHFGGDAEVLSPAGARAHIQGTLKEMLARYETSTL